MSCLLDFKFVLKATQGFCLQEKKETFDGVGTDSRKALNHKIFFALKGRQFDGHNYLHQAFKQGAKAFIVSDKHKAKGLNTNCAVIHVQDTLKALQNLAKAWTKQLETQVVGITGSNGKTTTKNFAKTLFSSLNSFTNPKSYNNHIGVPLSLLTVNHRKAFLIQEIGTNAPGEIASLTSLCHPIISTVTMVGPSHLKGLKTLESVAKEKQDIYLKSQNAIWLFNRDNTRTEKMFQKLRKCHKSILTFSSYYKKADVYFRFLKEELKFSWIKGRIGSKEGKSKVSLSGQHNLSNLMCASGLALGAGVDPQHIWELLSKCQPSSGRQQWFFMKEKNISILFDAYNANPSSMNVFLKSCEKFVNPDKLLLILGDMKELGEQSQYYHIQLASQPALLKSRFIGFIGEYGELVETILREKGFKGHFVRADTYDKTILSSLQKELKLHDTVAVKASRQLKLEKLLFDLTNKTVF